MATRRNAVSATVNSYLLKLAKRARGSVSVGFIDSPQAPIAYLNEFGHKGRFPAPPRPFFRTMVAKDSGNWPGMMAEELKANGLNGRKTMAFMGGHIEGELKKSIIDFSGTPLSPVTLVLRHQYWTNPQDIRARDVLAAQELVKEGNGVGILLPGKRRSRSKKAPPMVTYTQSRPLVWTHAMLNAPTYKVAS